jgi:hypothetical protein
LQDPKKPVRLEFHAKVEGGGPFTRFIGAILGVAVIIAALFLSVFVFAGLLAVAVIAGGWFWWRTRRLRRQLRETIDRATQESIRQAQARANATAADPAGKIIEGDFIRTKPPTDAPPRRD